MLASLLFFFLMEPKFEPGLKYCKIKIYNTEASFFFLTVKIEQLISLGAQMIQFKYHLNKN